MANFGNNKRKGSDSKADSRFLLEELYSAMNSFDGAKAIKRVVVEIKKIAHYISDTKTVIMFHLKEKFPQKKLL